MFVVGLKLDVSVLRRRSHAAVVVSHASIIVPFILGALLALLLYPRLSNQRVDFLHFALFGGVAMSVTAFPVLSRILTDIRADSTRLGAIALSCAAVDDVTAWCLLAFVVSMVNGRAAGGLLTVVLALAYLGVMLVAVRPLLVRLTRPLPRWIEKQVPGLVLLMLLLSATATELIGIHAVFGAFALGAVIPRESRTARDLTRSLEDLVVTLFLPAFFICTGLRTQLGLLAGAEQWLLAGLILLVACLGKFGGTLVAARGVGLGWRDAAGLGILMNTRGLMELIVLNLGVDLGVISPPLFAMLVLMAIVTTAATSPLLHVMKVFERAGSPD
jgi:Kef-type K+ transport system membrane component KefB